MKNTILSALEKNTLFRFTEAHSADQKPLSTIFEVVNRTHDTIHLQHNSGWLVIWQGQKTFNAQVRAF